MDAESSFAILAGAFGKTWSNSLTGCRATEDGHAQMESILKEPIAHIVC
jgi:hypothetical protein